MPRRMQRTPNTVPLSSFNGMQMEEPTSGMLWTEFSKKRGSSASEFKSRGTPVSTTRPAILLLTKMREFSTTSSGRP